MNNQPITFSGNIFVFHAFDIGDDINLEGVKQSQEIQSTPLNLPKYFKYYHTPLAIERPHPHNRTKCIGSKIHHFGAISLTYRVPFEGTLDELRKEVTGIEYEIQKEATSDAAVIFRKIKPHIKQPRFFHHRTSYMLIQIDPQPDRIRVTELKEMYGTAIAATLRFETESLSEAQKNEILDSAIGYYRGDLIIIDTESSFAYNKEYEEIIDLFEFANLHRLELQSFDKILDHQLNIVYERKVDYIPFKMYLPFIGTMSSDVMGDLGRLKVDISVITERLANSIKLAGEEYYEEIYSLLTQKLDLPTWKASIDNKLEIIKDIRSVYDERINIIREDILSILIIILIFIELIVGIMHYLKL